jgi:hypothetical protein
VGTEEGEEVKLKSIGNILNKTIAENFPSLKKEMPIQELKASSTPGRHDQK